MAGMNANHAFALWFTARSLKPKYVIENGVWRGQSTWLLRQAVGPEAYIFSLDPGGRLDPGYVRGVAKGDVFEDPNPRSRRMMGLDFRDFGDVNWAFHVPEEDYDRVFVMFDDHVDHLARLRQVKAFGFVHAWFDDNTYWNGGDCYSMNQLCADIPDGATALKYLGYRLRERGPGQALDFYQVGFNISLEEHAQNVEWVRKNVEIHFEFPPIHDGCGWDTPHQLLSAEGLMGGSLPSLEEDEYHYRHFHTPYVKLMR